MTGVFILLLSVFTGYSLTSGFFNTHFKKYEQFYGFTKEDGKTLKTMILFPVYVLTGFLLFTWLSYLISYLFLKTAKPLLYGNVLTVIILAAISCCFLLRLKGDRKWGSYVFDKIRTFIYSLKRRLNNENDPSRKHRGLENHSYPEMIYIAAITFFWTFFMYRSFHITGNKIKVGVSVFSDFGPHLAIIRSFSAGLNFPTEYPHFADGTIRYHFLFQFLAGNLEYLGLRLDHAFNLPGILSMVAFLMLLYSLAVIITGRKWVGIIASILFHFRSSFAFFTYREKFDSPGSFFSSLISNKTHIGNTTHEDWGLWAQKVFVNQRHLSFGIGILIVSLIIMLPYLYNMLDSLRKTTLKSSLTEFAFKKDAWIPDDLRPSIISGLLLGSTGFINGAAVISALSLLFVLALFSKQRLAFLCTAVITVVLVMAQTIFFTRGGEAINPRLVTGFLAGDKSLAGIIRYYIELLGILPLVLVAYLAVSFKKVNTYSPLILLPAAVYTLAYLAPQISIIFKATMLLALAVAGIAASFCKIETGPGNMPVLLPVFLAPVVTASVLQVTPDITVNHKYVIIGVTLLNILAASYLLGLFSLRKPVVTAVAVLLSLLLIVTGLADIVTLYNLDTDHIEIDVRHPLTSWALENTEPDEIFLTPMYSLHPLLLAGRKIFYGWPYYAWSAGYNTYYRESVMKRIYSAASPAELSELVEEHSIDYIVVENDNRNSDMYRLNEALIEETYEEVYSADGYRIFRTCCR